MTSGDVILFFPNLNPVNLSWRIRDIKAWIACSAFLSIKPRLPSPFPPPQFHPQRRQAAVFHRRSQTLTAAAFRRFRRLQQVSAAPSWLCRIPVLRRIPLTLFPHHIAQDFDRSFIAGVQRRSGIAVRASPSIRALPASSSASIDFAATSYVCPCSPRVPASSGSPSSFSGHRSSLCSAVPRRSRRWESPPSLCAVRSRSNSPQQIT